MTTGTTIRNPRSAIRNLQSPLLVTLVVAVLYLAVLGWLWVHFHGDPLGFVHEGTVFTQNDPNGTRGYDGQFYYYIATDPFNAANIINRSDNATFRLQRLFYPILTMILSFGQVSLVPYVMIIINFLSVVGGTLLVALLLSRWRRSPWFALSYSLSSGIPVALTFDTAEPLTFALVALGVYLWDRARPLVKEATEGQEPEPTQRLLNYEFGGGLAFAAALLTRELALYFVGGYALVALYKRQWLRLFLAIAAFVPVTAWSLYLSLTSHYLGVSFAQPFEWIPFIAYFLQLQNPNLRSVAYAAQYIVPAAAFGVLAIWSLVRTWRAPSPLVIAVLGNVHLMTFLFRAGYQHQVAVSRYFLGLALAGVIWAGSARPRWLLWLTPLFAISFLIWLYAAVRQDPAFLW